MAKCLLGRWSNTQHRPVSVGLDWPVRPWPLFTEIPISSCIFLFSSPFSASVWIHTASFRGCWLGPPDLAGKENPPPPSSPHHLHILLYQMQVQIRGCDTLVKTCRPQILRQPALYMHPGANIPGLHRRPSPLGLFVTAGYWVAAGTRHWWSLWWGDKQDAITREASVTL